MGIFDDIRDLVAVCIVEVTGRTWPTCDRCTSAATCSIGPHLLCVRCAPENIAQLGPAEIVPLPRVPAGAAEIRERALKRLGLRLER
jgi:hypothetical protein